MTKVTVIIDGDDYSITLQYGDKIYTMNWKLTDYGSTCLDKGDWYDRDLPEEIADAMSLIDSAVYDIASYEHEWEEEDDE